MKKPGKKAVAHLVFIGLLIITALLGWPIIFSLINFVYVLFIVRSIFCAALRRIKSRWLKMITGTLIIIGMLPMVSIMILPSFIVNVKHSEENPDMSENVDEYHYRHGIKLHNASYFISYMHQAYEGNLSESDFKELARLSNWDYQKFDQPKTFEYTAAELIKSHLDKGYDPKPVTIKSGYIYHYRQRNGGGLLVMYDLNSQRLYTRSNPR